MVCWGFQEQTDKEGTQLETLAGLHKDARNELQAEEAVRLKVVKRCRLRSRAALLAQASSRV